VRAAIALLVLLALPVAALADEADEQDSTSREHGWTADLELWSRGPRIDGEGWGGRLGGRFVFDAIAYGSDNLRDSGLEADDVRLILEGWYDPFRVWIEPDLLGVDTRRHLYEAWGAWEPHESLHVTAGQLLVALGSEFATRPEHLPVPGYGFTSYLGGRYDIGARAQGSLLEETFWYEATATVGNGFDLEGFALRSPYYCLRVVSQPFAWHDPEEGGVLSWLRGLYVGGGLAYLDDFDDPVVLATPLESIVFRTGDLGGDSGWWAGVEAGFRYGPVRIAWEAVSGSANDVPVGGGHTVDLDQLGSWALYASWNITGEEQVYSKGRWEGPERVGERSILPEGFLPGRWEIAARYSNADVDRRLFDEGLTTYDPSTQEVRTFTLNLTWQPVEPVRLGLGWVTTIADHELATFGGTNRDSSFLLRLELDL
jgi:hypothetical protein